MQFAMAILLVTIGVTIALIKLYPCNPVAERYRLLEAAMADHGSLHWITDDDMSISLQDKRHTSPGGVGREPFVLAVRHASSATLASRAEWGDFFEPTSEPIDTVCAVEVFEIRPDSTITGTFSRFTAGEYCGYWERRPVDPDYVEIDRLLNKLFAK